VHALERVDHLTQGVIAFEDFAAEALAGDFDLLGQGDFFVALQQGNLTHLGEVHADGIVDAAAVGFLFEEGEVEVAVVVGGAGAGTGLTLLRFRLVDQLDALFLQEHEQLIEFFGIDGVVRQVLVDLAVGQISLDLARIDERFQAVVDFQFHLQTSVV
jgi:hypothetical protein